MFNVDFAENDSNMRNKGMKKIYLCTSLMFFASALLFSQELILKVKNHANIVGWVYQKENLEDSYCLYDDNYLIFASSTNQKKPIIYVYKEHSYSIISGSFYISNKEFVALDSENMVLKARFDAPDKSTMRKVHENLVAQSIALSPNDEMIITGFANGFIQTHYLLKHAEKNFDVHFKAHNDVIYSISFNSMGQYFITSGKDERIKIWDAKTLNLIKEFSHYCENLCPSIFSPLNDNFAYCTSRQTLCVSDIDGKLQKEIAIMDGIRLIKFTEKKDRIAVLTDSKRLEFYNVETGKYEGAIDTLQDICSFDVNIVTGAILLGTEEGEVYLASNRDIKIRATLQKTQIKKKQINETSVNEEAKVPTLSTNILKYLALEEDDNIQESVAKKPSFSVKDESPLEDPITFTTKTETNKKVPNKTLKKTLNETGLDEEGVEFQESSTEKENPAPEETTETTQQEETEQEDEPQENEENQENEESQEDENV